VAESSFVFGSEVLGGIEEVGKLAQRRPLALQKA
jgi:hypothetical protein